MAEFGIKVKVDESLAISSIDNIEKKLLGLEKTGREVGKVISNDLGAAFKLDKGLIVSNIKSILDEINKLGDKGKVNIFEGLNTSLLDIPRSANTAKNSVKELLDLLKTSKANGINLTNLNDEKKLLSLNALKSKLANEDLARHEKLKALKAKAAQEELIHQAKLADFNKRAAIAQEAAAIRTASIKRREEERARKTTISQDYEKMEERSINERIAKIQVLKRVRAEQNSTDEDGKRKVAALTAEINRLTKANNDAIGATQRLKEQQSQAFDIQGQLIRKMALFFSVSQVQNFLITMAKTRGEFELQNKALAAILQNKNEANKLFAQVTALAVKSPFQLKELITATKQLSAYRIETEKLFDTTKMLADVSAGLGVDMNRLILAYGQVKAANFLRGQELRQFSEAGINILGELADKFTEVNGRAVTTGEVFEMVSKRMVTFKDVDEIFQKMTSDGGIFYKMQELQADTLAGKISNLTDAFDIMFNKLGTEYESELKGSVDMVRYLVENYEDLVLILKFAVGGFAIYKSAAVANILVNKLLIGSIKDTTVASVMANLQAKNLYKALGILKVAGLSLVAVIKKIGLAIASNPWLAAAALIGAVVAGIVNATRASRELYNALDKIKSSGLKEAGDLGTKFERLSKAALGAASGTKEQREALQKLQSTYKDLLPSQALTIDGLKAMEGNYKSVTSAIYEKIKAQKIEEGIAEIQSSKEPDITSARKALTEELKALGVMEADAYAIVDEFRKRLESGSIKGVTEDIAKLVYEMSGFKISFRDTDFESIYSIFYSTESKINDFTNAIEDLNNELKNFESSMGQTFTSFGSYNDEYKQLKDTIKGTISELQKGVGETDFQFNQRKLKVQQNILILWAAKTGKLTIDEINKALSGEIKLETKNMPFLNVFEDIKKQVAQLRGSNISQEVTRILTDYEATLPAGNKANLGVALFGDETQLSEYFSNLNGYIDENIKEIERLGKQQQQTKNIIATTQDVGLRAFSETELKKEAEEIQRLKQEVEGYRLVLERFGATKDEKKGGEGKDMLLERVKNQIKAIKDAQKSYEEYLKVFTKTESLDKLKAIFGDVFKSLDLNINMDYTDTGIVKTLSKLIAKAGKKGAEEIAKEIRDLKPKIEIEAQIKDLSKIKKEFDNLFGDYELSLEIGDLSDITGIDLGALFRFEDTTSFDAITKKYNEVLGNLGLGEYVNKDLSLIDVNTFDDGLQEQLKLAQSYQSKIRDIEARGAKERLKELESLTKELMTSTAKLAGEKTIKITTQEDLEKTILLIDAQKKKIVELSGVERDEAKQKLESLRLDKELYEKRIENSNKIIAQLESEAFKGTQIYQKMFGDIEMYSNYTLKKIVENAKTMTDKAVINADSTVTMDVVGKGGDMKQTTVTLEVYNSLLSKTADLQKTIRDNDPFAAAKEIMQAASLEINEADAALSSAAQALSEFNEENKNLTEPTEDQNKLLEEQNKLLEEQESLQLAISKASGVDNREEAEAALANFNKTNKKLLSDIAKQNELYEKQESLAAAVKNAEINLEIARNNSNQATLKSMESVQKATQQVIDVASSIKGVFDSVGGIAEALGADDETLAIIDDISKGIGVLIGILAAVAAVITLVTVAIKILNTSAAPLLWIVTAIAAVAAGLTAIFSAKDRKLEKQINTLQTEIDRLGDSINRLQTALGNSTNFDEFKKNLDDINKKLDEQEAKIKKQKELEQDRKKPDREALYEYEQTLLDIDEQRKQAAETFRDSFGIFELKDAASELFDVWNEARIAGEDTFEALDRSLKKFVANAIKQMVIMAGVDKLLKPLQEAIAKALEGDGKIDLKEAENLLNIGKNTAEGIDNYFEAVKPLLEMFDTNDLAGNMSELQKGIQGITETTAQALESLLNTIRFEIFRHNVAVEAQLLTISNEIKISNNIQGKMLDELEGIHTLIKEVRSWQNSITSPAHSKGGNGIKMFMD